MTKAQDTVTDITVSLLLFWLKTLVFTLGVVLGVTAPLVEELTCGVEVPSSEMIDEFSFEFWVSFCALRSTIL